MRTYAKVFMSNGDAYEVICDKREEFLDLLEDKGLVELYDDLVINPLQVTAVEFLER